MAYFRFFSGFQCERKNCIRFVSGFPLKNSHYVAKITWKILVPTKFIRFAMVESFDLGQKWLEKLQKRREKKKGKEGRKKKRKKRGEVFQNFDSLHTAWFIAASREREARRDAAICAKSFTIELQTSCANTGSRKHRCCIVVSAKVLQAST